MSRWQKAGLWILGLIVLATSGLGAFRLLGLNYVENYELGYKYDTRTGTITVLERTGYIMTLPFVVKVHTIDLRPMQVCINANHRVLNCKMVKFNPEGLQLFLEWHGRGDYEGDYSTTNTGTSSDDKDLADILMGYAYDGTDANYPFLTILTDMQPNDEAYTFKPPIAPEPEPGAPR